MRVRRLVLPITSFLKSRPTTFRHQSGELYNAASSLSFSSCFLSFRSFSTRHTRRAAAPSTETDYGHATRQARKSNPRTTPGSTMQRRSACRRRLEEVKQFRMMSARQVMDWTHEAAHSGEEDRRLWTAAAERLTETMKETEVIPHDLVRCLRAFRTIGYVDIPLLECATAPCLRVLHRLKPTELMDVLRIYDEAQWRPESLFTRVMSTLEHTASAMLPAELTDVVSSLAHLHLGNPVLLAACARALVAQLARFTCLQLTALTGALRQLHVQSDPLFSLIDDRLDMEVQLMTLQELLQTHQSIKKLPLSWSPYEDRVELELRSRLEAVQGSRDIQQFAEPIAAFTWIQQHQLVSEEYLKALAGWCTQECRKRHPRLQATDILRLYEALRESNLDPDVYLGEAVRASVVTGARSSPEGSSGPLQYKRKRRYVRMKDPLIPLGQRVRPLDSPELQTSRMITALHHPPAEVPPGLVIAPDRLKQRFLTQPHIGALWSATVARPRCPSRSSKTIRYTDKRAPPKIVNTPVPGYTLGDDARPIKHPLRWL